jgi:large subunit ribosomal protein L25
MRKALSIYRRLQTSLYREGVRSLSSLKTDPAKFVYNLKEEKIQENPAVEAFMKANFPEAFVTEEQHEQSLYSADALLPEMSDVTEIALETAESKLNIRSLTCYLRDPVLEEGSRQSRRMREEDIVPGLLYGSDPTLGIFSHQPESKTFIKTPWRVLQRELDRYHRGFESRVYDLTVLESPDDDSGGTVHRVIPKNVQRHPVMSSIYCANYCRYHAGRPIKIPLVYINEEESPVLKRDGFIVPIQRSVECFVEDGAPIPENLELECTGLRYKQVVRRDRVLLPDGVRFSDRVIKKGDLFIIGVVFGGKSEGTDTDTAVGEK